MGNPAFGQRTPVIGLKLESDDTRNFNWSKIDDAFGRLQQFMEDTMTPPTALIPRSAVSDITTLQLTTAMQQVAQVQMSPSGGGPYLCLGTVGCRIQNNTGTTAAATIQLTLSRSLSSAPETHTFSFNITLAANEITTLFQIPIAWFFTAIDPVPMSPTVISLTMADLAGTASVTSFIQFGYMQAVEFLAQVRS